MNTTLTSEKNFARNYRRRLQRKQNRTKQALTEMLKESTGTHFLDSGGAYGRQWQRNQSRDFDKEPVGTFKVDIYRWHRNEDETDTPIQAEFNVSLSLYHFLLERCDFDSRMQATFDRYCNLPENEDKNYLALQTSFIEDVLQEKGCEITRPYTGEPGFYHDNTYNYCPNLDQDFQYAAFTIEDGPLAGGWISVSAHGGCDIRGGYSKPRWFRCSFEEQSPLEYTHDVISCDGNFDHHWERDGEGEYYFDGGTRDPSLDSYEISQDPKDRGQGKLYVDEDKIAYCPLCGSPLNAFPF